MDGNCSSCTSNGWELCSVNHTSIYDNTEIKVSRKFGSEISSDYPNDLFVIDIHKIFERC